MFIFPIVLFFGVDLCLSLRLATSQKNPYGISNFKKIVKDNYFFFDKTEAIVQIEELGDYLKIWRPRRSGKTLFCNQLALYYDKAEIGNKVFDNTYIGKHPTPNKSKYLVLSLSFSNVDSTGDVKGNFRNYINGQISKFSSKYRAILKEEIEIDILDHFRSMENLFWAVEKAEEEVYLIVDEYDTFVNRLLFDVDTTSSDLGYNQYKSTIAAKESVLRNFGDVLKTATNTVLSRMFITGVTPMAFSDGLSSLNMVKDLSTNSNVESLFGYTEVEIKSALEQIFPAADGQKDIDTHLEIMRNNFNGYRFNSEQAKSVYNPQMCLYYLDHLKQTGEPPYPLLDTNMASQGDYIAQFLAKNYRGFSSSIGPFDLLRAKAGLPLVLQKSLDSFRSEQLFRVETVDSVILSLAFHHGYLTYGNPLDPANKGCLICPNKVYQDILLDAILQSNSNAMKQILDISGTGDKSMNKLWTAFKDKLEDYAIDKILDSLKPKLPYII